MAFRKELIIAVIAVAVGWAALMVVLARMQGGRAMRATPALLHYPGTESVREQLVPSLGWRKYWFTLNQDYPSSAVYQFYQRELPRRGWRRLGGDPAWVRSLGKEQARDVFQTMWVSGDGIYEVDLQMVSTATVARRGGAVITEKRKPGIEVYVTLRRSLGPWLLVPQGKAVPPGAIDVKETGK